MISFMIVIKEFNSKRRSNIECNKWCSNNSNNNISNRCILKKILNRRNRYDFKRKGRYNNRTSQFNRIKRLRPRNIRKNQRDLHIRTEYLIIMMDIPKMTQQVKKEQLSQWLNREFRETLVVRTKILLTNNSNR